MIDVKDEAVEIEQQLRAEAAANVRKDKTYEDFMGAYKNHLDKNAGQAQARVAGRPETAPFDPKKVRAVIAQQAENPYEEEEKQEFARLLKLRAPALAAHLRKSTESYQSKLSHVSGRSKTKTPGSKASQRGKTPTSIKNDEYGEEQDLKSERKEPEALPEECKLEILKKNIILELEENYYLIAHPFPQINGELLLIQQSEFGEKSFWINDFSLRKRKPYMPVISTKKSGNFGGGMNKV